MVVFTCSSCGDSLKKNQVEKHYMTKCRNCEVLSCVDCGKDFWGNDYQTHTKCISEEEKYSGKNYVPKPNANKGEIKQTQWLQQVQVAIDKSTSNPRLKGLLERMKDYPNIPRKKAKFENFVKNSLNYRETYLVTQAWDVLMANTNQNKPQENGNASKNNQADKSVDEKKSDDADEKCDEKKMNKREKKEERRKKSNKKEKKDKSVTENGLDINEHKSKKHKNKNTKTSDDDNKSDEDLEEKKSKKRKKKSTKTSDDGNESDEDLEEKKSKKRKKKNTKTSDDCNESDEDLEKKKNKKHKKRKTEETEDKIAKKRKVSSDEEDEGIDDDEDVVPVKLKFDWLDCITQLLKSKGEMTVKKLRKKVLAEFASQGGKAKSEEKLFAKFNKKISKNPTFVLHKERVKLRDRK